MSTPRNQNPQTGPGLGPAPGTSTGDRTPIQAAALGTGVVFVLVGILGFVPGITSHYGDMSFAEHMSDAKLLGIFQVSVLHNLVHLLFGVAGVVLARTAGTARTYLLAGGVVYLVLWVYGLAIGMGSEANFVPVNNADNWLHLALGLGMIAAGLTLWSRSQAQSRTYGGSHTA